MRAHPSHQNLSLLPELLSFRFRRPGRRFAGTKTAYIEPGSPWENPFVESFNSRLRDELLNIEDFGSITEAKLIIEDWRIESTTPTGHTQRWTDSHLPNTQTPLRTTNNQTAYSPWSTYRDPVNLPIDAQ